LQLTEATDSSSNQLKQQSTKAATDRSSNRKWQQLIAQQQQLIEAANTRPT